MRIDNRAETVQTVDGEWMVLVGGVQWGRDRDASGAASETWASEDAARDAYMYRHDRNGN